MLSSHSYKPFGVPGVWGTWGLRQDSACLVLVPQRDTKHPNLGFQGPDVGCLPLY